MNILIVTPAPKGPTKGNRITAHRWAQIIKQLGHRIKIAESFDGGDFDLLIALHAGKSADSIKRFRKRFPARPIAVAITGTDLHIELHQSKVVANSLKMADQIIMLEPEGAKLLDRSLQKKVDVIYQSATPVSKKPKKLTRFFEVSVVGHLRKVKDPFRTAIAARSLPEESSIRVVHLGQALDEKMKRRAVKEMESSRRYRWIGSVPHGEAQRRLARSHLTVLTSECEGAPSTISEAIVNDVPVLATRIVATIGLLGPKHPGLFEFGDTDELAAMLLRAEQDKGFYRSLLAAGKKLKPKFKPATEVKSWRSLLKRFT